MAEKNLNACGPFGTAKLKFPVTFDLKVIMTMISLQDNQEILKKILEGRNIPHSNWSEKYSSEGKFISLSVQITLKSKELMESLYNDLKQESTVKFAI